ncbi:hypothetical protein KIPB_001928, partial [Kipferlia bialata]
EKLHDQATYFEHRVSEMKKRHSAEVSAFSADAEKERDNYLASPRAQKSTPRSSRGVEDMGSARKTKREKEKDKKRKQALKGSVSDALGSLGDASRGTAALKELSAVREVDLSCGSCHQAFSGKRIARTLCPCGHVVCD